MIDRIRSTRAETTLIAADEYTKDDERRSSTGDHSTDARELTEEETIAEIERLIVELNIAHERRSKKLAQMSKDIAEIKETFDWFLMR